ncbi:23531_t:CDS:2 [Cetraspora pellucida]|uniref:23531_t:CDS:1 n=1 Tax=Cetraspora pellucida TaxID=1433469 RepID=A0A9N9A292_9GLOM|nr:23531_t:CDS:2 [Cetraspora pellucida]
MTINPADLHSSIVIMYAGEEININNLLPEEFPTATERVRLAHLDSTAVAKYFNNLIENIIKFILGYRKPEGGVLEEMILDHQLCEVMRKNPEAAKIQQIERSIVGYNNIDDIEILDNQNNFNSTFTLDPYKIMRLGLNNAEFVDKISINLNENKKILFFGLYHCEQNYPDNSNRPPQLLVYLGDAGGTGKSEVIKAIKQYFEQIGKD